MKIKLRLLFIFLFLILSIKIFLLNDSSSAERRFQNNQLLELNTYLDYNFSNIIPKQIDENYNDDNKKYSNNYETCTIETCFNIDKCNVNKFKVYIYERPKIIYTKIYDRILQSIRSSSYYTNNSNEACLFLLSIDTLDRDRLSNSYVEDLNAYISNLNLWNNGENHLIFNLYSGTWSNYIDNLDFDFGKAILIQTSLSSRYYRPNFDISFPLFHSTLGSDLISYDEKIFLSNDAFKSTFEKKKYFLTFKGKRYLSGIGSKARNALYHLNNKRDIFMLTTCNHTSNFQVLDEDERCEVDNILYKKYDYDDLLYNSTFCLIPRGRRLATYRFLEALKAGCIPVLLSNGWILPFSEVLNWDLAVVWADEEFITQIYSLLRKIPPEKLVEMRRYSLVFFNQYFLSIKRIVHTSLEILYERLFPEKAKPSILWNSEPGVFYYDEAYSTKMSNYPFAAWQFGEHTFGNCSNLCTLIITCDNRNEELRIDSIIYDLSFIDEILIINCKIKSVQTVKKHIRTYSIKKNLISLWYRLLKNEFSNTNCLIHINNKFVNYVSDKHIEYAYNIWKLNQHQIIGFNGLNVYWNGSCKLFDQLNKTENNSMISFDFLIVHRYYIYRLLKRHNIVKLCNLVELSENLAECFAISLNILVNKITRSHPLITLSNKSTTKKYGTNKKTCIDYVFKYIERLY